jgi:hypothetical protein
MQDVAKVAFHARSEWPIAQETHAAHDVLDHTDDVDEDKVDHIACSRLRSMMPSAHWDNAALCPRYERQNTEWQTQPTRTPMTRKSFSNLQLADLLPFPPLGASAMYIRKLTPAYSATPIMNATPHRSLSGAPRAAFYFPIESGSPL